jgi:hypothetical protein
MVVVHRTTKDGYSYATLDFTTNKSRGAAICKNDRSVSERKIRTVVIEMLREQLTGPDLVARFVRVFQKRVGELQQTAAAPDPAVRLLQEQERRVKNLYDGLAKMGWSEGLAEQIKSEEANLSVLRAKAVTGSPAPSTWRRSSKVRTAEYPTTGVGGTGIEPATRAV